MRAIRAAMRRLAIFLMLTATVASVPAVAAGSPSAPELPDPVPVRRMLGARARDELAVATAGPDDGSAAVCYIAGSWERWRPDARRSPIACSAGRPGWPGERWLDIGRTAILRPIMERRLAMCERKGFDAVEFDNVDG